MCINPSHDILWSATAKGIHPDTPPRAGVAIRLSSMLACIANFRRGSESLRPTKFSAAVEHHANQGGAREAAVHGGPACARRNCRIFAIWIILIENCAVNEPSLVLSP